MHILSHMHRKTQTQIKNDLETFKSQITQNINTNSYYKKMEQQASNFAKIVLRLLDFTR